MSRFNPLVLLMVGVAMFAAIGAVKLVPPNKTATAIEARNQLIAQNKAVIASVKIGETIEVSGLDNGFKPFSVKVLSRDASGWLYVHEEGLGTNYAWTERFPESVAKKGWVLKLKFH